MSKRETASLVVKLMGVFILIRSVPNMASAISYMLYDHQRQGDSSVNIILIRILSVAAGILLPVAFSLAVIKLSDRVAGWLVKDDSVMPAGPAVSSDNVMRVVISCIGIYFIVLTLPLLLSHIGSAIASSFGSHSSPKGYSRMFSGTSLSSVASSAIQLSLGVWLFVGSRGIVRLWKKTRSRKTTGS